MVVDPTVAAHQLLRREATSVVRVGSAPLLAVLVVAGAAVRSVAGFFKVTPVYFPDEYLYAQLGRSLSETGRPLVRGASPHFPALLQPILTAPAWLLGDAETSYRVIQVAGAVAMSLVAIPVFALGVRLGLSRRVALLIAALSLALPDLMYASWILAEPFAYPLALGALAAGTLALATASRRSQVTFLVLAALATFARAQFIVLPLCYLVATLGIGLGTRSLRRVAREQWLPGVVLGLGTAMLLVAAPGRLLGVYDGAVGAPVHPIELVHNMALNGLGLAYSAGWILVPGALLGLAAALLRPRSATELAFGALGGAFVLALLAEASLYGDAGRVQERYFFYAVPVLALAFGLLLQRGWPHRRLHALLAAAAACVAVAVPVSAFADGNDKRQSPFLFAVARLQQLTGSTTGTVVVAAVAAGLSLTAIALSRRPRIGGYVVLATAFAALTAASVGAADFDVRNTTGVRSAFLPADKSWVDSARLPSVTLIHAAASTTDTLSELFWNQSIRRVAVVPGGTRPDAFASESLSIGRDGALTVKGKPLLGPLLVDGRGDVRPAPRRADNRGVTDISALGHPIGPARLALYMPGRFADGWLGARASLHLWPQTRGGALAGTVTLALSVPAGLGHPVDVRIIGTRKPLVVHIAEGAMRRVELAVCTRGSWDIGFAADIPTIVGGRALGVRATPPLWRPDRHACAAD